jgi:hypothetical protein
MRCQGNYIGMTQRCKWFLGSVYLAGAIPEREVYRSGTGAKGHGQQEKKLLWEVIDLFLGDCIPLKNDSLRYFERKLEHGTVSVLEKQLTTKLDRTRLEKECRINSEDDAASWLFNGVHHIYNCINVAKNREQEMVGPGSKDDIVDVLDEVMDHEANDILPNMDDHVFDDEYEDDDADENESDTWNELLILLTQQCLLNLNKIGWEELEKVNVREVRQHATDCLVWKRVTMKYIMRQVIKMESSTRAVSVCEENPRAEFPPWSCYMNEIQSNYYL